MIAAPKKGKSSFQRRISKRMSKVKKNVKSQKECQKSKRMSKVKKNVKNRMSKS